MEYIAGVDIGGTKIAATLFRPDGELLAKVVFPTRVERGPEAALAEIRTRLEELRRGRPAERLLGIGISCGGPLDSRTGLILSPPNLPGWASVPVTRFLSEAFRVPARLENDANAGALAEFRFGAGRASAASGRPVRNLVFMTMGTGIGAGLILDGRLYRGATGLAGEIGHTKIIPGGPECGCGGRGCLEALAAGPAIARRARERRKEFPASRIWTLAGGRPEAVTAAEVFAAAAAGDRLGRLVVEETAYYLGLGLANLVNLLNPEVIVLGTIATRYGDFFLEPVRRVVAAEAWPDPVAAVRITGSPLGDLTGDYAALAVFLDQSPGA